MTTNFNPVAGGSIADLDSGTPVDRLLDTAWDVAYGYGYVMVANASDAVVYLVTENDATTGGRSISAGGSGVYGPYQRGVTLYLYGLGSGSAHYDFDLVRSEGR